MPALPLASTMTRRDHMKGLLSAAIGAFVPVARAAAPADPIPPEGIGRRIRHVSYSDQGGRPDAVQVMVNRKSTSGTCSATASQFSTPRIRVA